MSAPRPRRRTAGDRRKALAGPGAPAALETNLEARDAPARGFVGKAAFVAENGPPGSRVRPIGGGGRPPGPLVVELTEAGRALLELEREPFRVLSRRVAVELATLAVHVRCALEPGGAGVDVTRVARVLEDADVAGWLELVPRELLEARVRERLEELEEEAP